jgi:hypothetical protein
LAMVGGGLQQASPAPLGLAAGVIDRHSGSH